MNEGIFLCSGAGADLEVLPGVYSFLNFWTFGLFWGVHGGFHYLVRYWPNVRYISGFKEHLCWKFEGLPLDIVNIFHKTNIFTYFSIL